jgi:hypothetical protein
MPKQGYITITISDNDKERLFNAGHDILQNSPVDEKDLSPAEILRLVLDEHDAASLKGKAKL